MGLILFTGLMAVANVYTIIMPPNMRPISPPSPLPQKKLFRYPWTVLSDLYLFPFWGFCTKRHQLD